jgi:hypothetical protein
MIDKKLGFYKVGDTEFESKIQACIYATKNKQDVIWNFNKEFFDNYPWHNEPLMSLDQLYDQRARQLREKYDYIIISYSGGADSHNVLMSFLRQNLRVDEIIVNTMEKGDPSYRNAKPNDYSAVSAQATEYIFQTLPRLKEIKSKYPSIKISVLDLTDHLFSNFKKFGDAGWIENKRDKLNPINITRYNYLYFSEIKKQFDKDKKIALILGIEKPIIYIHSKTADIHLLFVDGAANTAASLTESINEYDNAEVVYFYWSPDAADIICKQAHTVKKWLKVFPEKQNLWIGNKLTHEIYRLVHERTYRELLYTTWNSEWFQADKATSDWYSEFDHWFIKGQILTDHHKIWSEGIKYVEKNAIDFVKYTDEQASGLKKFYQDHKISNIHS